MPTSCSIRINDVTHPIRHRPRVAVLGGDGRRHTSIPTEAEVHIYAAAGYGGNGEARRLESAIRAGSIEHVFILTRWNSHEVTKRIRRLCKQLQVPVTFVR